MLALAAIAACAPSSPPPTPHPIAGRGGSYTPPMALHSDWHATAQLERTDSIVLTLPSGDRQLQRYTRRAVFAIDVARDGHVLVRLDSLATTPAEPNRDDPVGATWSADLDNSQIDGVHLEQGGDAAARLTRMVRDLLPTLPSGGAQSNTTWSDSSQGHVRVDVFNANERRIDTWSAGALTQHEGTAVLPVRMRESFEQLGDGSESGTRMTMTAQGRRSAVYYVTRAGQLTSAEVNDSVAMLISVPANRQVVPTQRFARTSVRYLTTGANPD